MIYFAMSFLAAFVSLFVWLASKAFRTRIAYGLGWSMAEADRPLYFWFSVMVYLLNAVIGCSLFVALLPAALKA
ncbi:hypothetical protein BH10PSE4_BH10PSE4_23850 [soil metagenome]